MKNRKLRRQTSAGSYTSIASQPSSMFRLSKNPKKVNKSAVVILLHHPSIFSHPTALPLHPRSASHSALILLSSSLLSSLTPVKDCRPSLLFPQL